MQPREEARLCNAHRRVAVRRTQALVLCVHAGAFTYASHTRQLIPVISRQGSNSAGMPNAGRVKRIVTQRGHARAIRAGRREFLGRSTCGGYETQAAVSLGEGGARARVCKGHRQQPIGFHVKVVLHSWIHVEVCIRGVGIMLAAATAKTTRKGRCSALSQRFGMGRPDMALTWSRMISSGRT